MEKSLRTPTHRLVSGPRSPSLCSCFLHELSSREGNPTRKKKNTHPKKKRVCTNNLRNSSAPLFYLFYKEKGGQFVQTVPKVFAQTLVLFGWVGCKSFLRSEGETMVSEGARPWGRGRSGDCEVNLLCSRFLHEPAKSKRGREEGDGTENVINCRDVCRKLS